MSFLSLFSPKVLPDEKARIAATISKFPRPNQFAVPKKPIPYKPITKITPQTKLHELANSERAYLPFFLLKIDHSFLLSNPEEWDQHPEAGKLNSFVKNFRVTNDCSERACQMVSDFHDHLPRDQQSSVCHNANVRVSLESRYRLITSSFLLCMN